MEVLIDLWYGCKSRNPDVGGSSPRLAQICIQLIAHFLTLDIYFFSFFQLISRNRKTYIENEPKASSTQPIISCKFVAEVARITI